MKNSPSAVKGAKDVIESKAKAIEVLAKIEALTFYTDEQQKKIEAFDKKINQLRKGLNKM